MFRPAEKALIAVTSHHTHTHSFLITMVIAKCFSEISSFLTIIIKTCFAFAGLHVLQRIGSNQEGNTSFTLCGDFYNRELSGRNIITPREVAGSGYQSILNPKQFGFRVRWLFQAGSPSSSRGPALWCGNSRSPAASTSLGWRLKFEPSREWTSIWPPFF